MKGNFHNYQMAQQGLWIPEVQAVQEVDKEVHFDLLITYFIGRFKKGLICMPHHT